MNDRFKFRIFEYETKEMIELDAVGYSSFDPFAEGKSRLIMIPSGLGNTFHYDKQCLYDNDKFSEPMQCTGLKDKNGKLIYEGDIVEVINCRGANAVVEYNIDLAMFKLKGEKFSPSALQHIRKDYFEVIGNIYTDAHLLEETKND